MSKPPHVPGSEGDVSGRKEAESAGAEGPAAGWQDAPVILFDSIRAMGIVDGSGHMTLCAERYVPEGKNGVIAQTVTVAHLRFGGNALQQLKRAIANIELLANPPAGGKN